MASNHNRQQCIKCDKGFAITICTGCQKWMCFKHLTDHRQGLQQNMDEISHEHDHLYQDLTNNNDEQHPFYSRIDAWQQKSIDTINQIAHRAREQLQLFLGEHRDELRKSLHDLAQEIQNSREKDDYTEVELGIWTEKFKALRAELEQPFPIEIIDDIATDDYNDEQSRIIPLLEIKRTKAIDAHESLSILTGNTQWTGTGETVAGGQGFGSALNQLSSPYAIDIDDQGTIYIADYNNHRIVAWKVNATSGELVAGGHGKGSRMDQLSYPIAILVDRKTQSLIISDWGNRRVIRWCHFTNERKKQDILVADVRTFGLAIDKEQSLYVSDWEKHEIRRYRSGSAIGEVVAGGNGSGDGLHQLNGPWGIFVDRIDQTIYVADRNNCRVMKWMKNAREGVIVAGGHGLGNSLKHLHYPTGIFVDPVHSVYVAELLNHRIVRWIKDANEGNVVIGEHGIDEREDALNCPFGLCVDRHGNIYVVDNNNHRIQRFSIKRQN